MNIVILNYFNLIKIKLVVGTNGGNVFLFNNSCSTLLWSFYVGHPVNERVKAVISTDGNS